MQRFFFSAISLLIIWGIMSCTDSCLEEKIDTSEIFRSVTLFNLSSDSSEVDLLKMLDEYKIVFEELDCPNSHYRLWKERGDRKGKYHYILEANWPNQETYDKVHNSEPYKKLEEKYGAVFKGMVQDRDYSRYVPLN